MARRSNRRRTNWVAAVDLHSTAGDSLTQISLLDPTTLEDYTEPTLTRIRGSIWVATQNPVSLPAGPVDGIVGMAIYYAPRGITLDPGASDDMSSEEVLWTAVAGGRYGYGITNPAQGSLSETLASYDGHRIDVDVSAQRILNSDEDYVKLALRTAPSGSTNGVVYSYILRLLVKE